MNRELCYKCEEFDDTTCFIVHLGHLKNKALTDKHMAAAINIATVDNPKFKVPLDCPFRLEHILENPTKLISEMIEYKYLRVKCESKQ